MPRCFHCKAETSRSHYDRTVHNLTPLYGPWSGWRMAGRVLVSPDGDRIAPERLRGILWAEVSRERLKSGRQGLGVVVALGQEAGQSPDPRTSAGTRSKASP